MLLPADYHMHTPLCHHAVGEPSEYAAQALKVGLTEIGFSEHNPMIRDDYDDWHMLQADLDDYVEKVQKARTDHPQLVIKLALEVDYIPGHEQWIRDLAGRYSWDYFIGSVHYISDSWDVDNPKKISEWKKRDPLEVWTIYFERLTQAAESKLFQIIGHADLPKKFGIHPKRDCTSLYEKFLETAARKIADPRVGPDGRGRGNGVVAPVVPVLTVQPWRREQVMEARRKCQRHGDDRVRHRPAVVSQLHVRLRSDIGADSGRDGGRGHSGAEGAALT
jgi:HisJ family histidinol phosphate phosphatase